MILLLMALFAGLAFGWHVSFWIVVGAGVIAFIDAALR